MNLFEKIKLAEKSIIELKSNVEKKKDIIRQLNRDLNELEFTYSGYYSRNYSFFSKEYEAKIKGLIKDFVEKETNKIKDEIRLDEITIENIKIKF